MIRHFHDTILGDLPSGWTVHKLRDLLSADYPGDWGDDAGEVEVTCVRGTNFTAEGQLDLTKLARRFLPRKQAAIMQPKQGDIFLEKSGGGPDQPVARVGFVNRDLPNYAFSNFVHLLRPDPEAVMPAYLGRLLAAVYLSGVVVRMEQQTTGIRNLNLRDYLDVLLPLPPPDEQTAIARILDAADTAIERARVAVKKAERVKTSLLQRVFGGSGSPRRISEFCKDACYGTSQASNDRGWGYPALRIPNVIGGDFNSSNLTFVDMGEANAKALALESGDALVVRTNGNPAYVGRAAIFYPPDDRIWLFASYLIRLRLSAELFPDYFQEFINSSFGRRELHQRVATSAGNYNLNIRNLRSIHIPWIEPDQQTQAVKLLRDANQTIRATGTRVTALERLKRGLMQDLLTGRVRVKATAAALAATV